MNQPQKNPKPLMTYVAYPSYEYLIVIKQDWNGKVLSTRRTLI